MYSWNGVHFSIGTLYRGRKSGVGIATRYGLEGPEIDFRFGRDFPQPSIPALGPNQHPIQWVPSLFPGGKAAGTWRWPPTPSIAEVKERLELYLYSPSGPSWPVICWNLPLPLHYSGRASVHYHHIDWAIHALNYHIIIKLVRECNLIIVVKVSF
jgi:hypothetical protein